MQCIKDTKGTDGLAMNCSVKSSYILCIPAYIHVMSPVQARN